MQETMRISERALFARINRALSKDGTRLRKTRPGSRESLNLGQYFAVETHYNIVANRFVHLEELGRELGVLKASEGVQWAEQSR
jgi:hypothetical protein